MTTRPMAVLLAACLLGAAPAAGASLDRVLTDPSVSVSGPGALGYDAIAELLDLSGTAVAAAGVVLPDDPVLYLAQPVIDAAGDPVPLPVSDASVFASVGTLLEGAILDASFDGDSVSLLYATGGGSLAAAFGPLFVVRIGGFLGPVNAPGDLPGLDGPEGVVAVFSRAAEVPLPAGLGLLLAALAGLGLVGRGRAARAAR